MPWNVRPTLRVLRELTAWDAPAVVRALSECGSDDVKALSDRLSPLDALPHPVIATAQTFAAVATPESCQTIHSARKNGLTLIEVRSGRLRAGLWTDRESDALWICAVGFAKGDHEDYDDFYKVLGRAVAGDTGRASLLPTDNDRRLLRRERNHQRLHRHVLELQMTAVETFDELHRAGGGTHRVHVPHVNPEEPDLFHIDLEVSTEPPDYLAITVEVSTYAHDAGIAHHLSTMFRIALEPCATRWKALDGTLFDALLDPGSIDAWLAEARQTLHDGRLIACRPPTHAHFAHQPELMTATVDGKAVTALCGVSFVPSQDHEALPVCEECENAKRTMARLNLP